MGVIRSVVHPGATRRRLAALGVFSLMAFYVQLAFAGPAAAAPLTGGFSPTIVSGGFADLNGNGVRNVTDDATAFYGDTDIIDGELDCNAWGALANDGSQGNGAIDNADDCSLVGYDGTAGGVTINVEDGNFLGGNGPLPTVFNEAQPNNNDIGDSDFAWSAIDGRVDSNGDEAISFEDCHFGVRGQADILGNDGTNPCGFATPPNTADNGRVDLNSDTDITSADSCSNGCFFGHNLVLGEVQEVECPGHEGDPRNDVVGTSGPNTLTGTAGADIICGFSGNDVLRGLGGNDLLLGSLGSDRLVGGLGADRLLGSIGNDLLFGGLGNDRMFGGRGNDRLDGGPGNDFGVGGLGRDTFVRCETRRQ